MNKEFEAVNHEPKVIVKDFIALGKKLENLAEKYFGLPFKSSEIKLSPEQEESLLNAAKSIQDKLHQKTSNPIDSKMKS